MLMAIQIRVRICIKTMPILMRILSQVVHILENQNFCNTYSHSIPIANLQYFIFLISVNHVQHFRQLFEIFRKKFSLSTFSFARN